MALPNFFKSYFYGRPGKRDFTDADLPENRLQLFRDVLSVRRGSMVGVNFLYLLCWIPAIIWTFLNLIQLYQLDAVSAGELAQMLDSIIYSWLLVLWPLGAITGPFNMGISYVMRNWARDEHSFILADFAAALKANWKQGLIYGAISGLVPLLSYLCLSFYVGMASLSPAYYLALAPVLLATLLWYLMRGILPTMIVTYNQGLGMQLKNALLMTLVMLPKAVLIKLATLVVPILALAAVVIFPAALSWIGFIVLLLYTVFMPAFNKLIYASWANYLCETYLNPKIEGAQTGIGLRPDRDIKEKK